MTIITNTKITLSDNTTSGTGSGELVRNGALIEYHDGTSSRVLVGRDTTDTLTNKTLTSPTLVTPALGTPASGTLTSCTGLPITGITSATSAQIATLCSNETGSGLLVFGTSPTLITPVLGTPASGVATNLTGTASNLTAGSVTTNADLTGDITSSGNATSIASGVIVLGDIATAAKTEAIIIAAGDETTAITVADGKTEFQMPYAFTLTEVRATLTTAGTTSGVTTIDIEDDGSTIFSTLLTIDSTEKTSTTAATAAVISGATLADSSIIKVNVDVLSGGATEAGLKIYLIGYQT